jgi:hypothetical protein
MLTCVCTECQALCPVYAGLSSFDAEQLAGVCAVRTLSPCPHRLLFSRRVGLCSFRLLESAAAASTPSDENGCRKMNLCRTTSHIFFDFLFSFGIDFALL